MPDHEVDNPPRATAGGSDHQLEAALLHLKEAIAASPLKEPTRPGAVDVTARFNSTAGLEKAEHRTALAARAAETRRTQKDAEVQGAEEANEVGASGSETAPSAILVAAALGVLGLALALACRPKR